MFCTKCGVEIKEDSSFCPQCGDNLKESTNIKKTEINVPKEKLLKCPKCRSTELTTSKKGFSAGQAIAGAVVAGGVGILAGAIGNNKIQITCLECGHTFKPGEDVDNARKKRIQKAKEQRESKQMMKSPIFWIFLIALIALYVYLTL